jgi:hypothetical protein
MSDNTAQPEVPITEEARQEGQDPYLASDPPFETVKEGQVDADR